MTRKRKLILNSTSSVIYQIIAVICGFVLPRLFLAYYGSEINGLVSSITQFLGFVSLAECGVGAVVQSALYKPLADNDMQEVSRIVVSSERFFKRIAYILLAYTGVLMVLYPLLTLDSFDYWFTLILIFVISISTFAQYYLGMTYRLLLNADQLGFIQYTIHSAALVVNTVSCILLMKVGASIQFVKLTTSIIFVAQPVVLTFIARKRYNIDHKIRFVGEPIKQKWNGLAQHIAGVILVNTDTIVLTLFSTLENVSIYAVYNLVVNGVKQIILSMTNGVRAMFGNMLAKNEIKELNHAFDSIEWMLHTLITFVFSVTSVLIIPFIRVYTVEITDAEYIVPAFAYTITLAQMVYCYRLPYYILVNAAGHYKQTQMSAIIEAAINVIVSVVLVFKLGLVGVAVGTVAAMAYRTIYLVCYLSRNILCRKVGHFLKHLIADALTTTALIAVVNLFPVFFTLGELNYTSWIILAIKTAVLGIVICILINLTLYGGKVRQMIRAKKRNRI